MVRTENTVRRPNWLVRTENSVFGERTTGFLTELDAGSQEISVRRPNDRFSDRTGWFAIDQSVRTPNDRFSDRTGWFADRTEYSETERPVL